MCRLTRMKIGENSSLSAENAKDWGFCSIFRTVDGNLQVLDTVRPTIGYQVRVDNPGTWLQTSPVAEIISDEPCSVVFRTVSGSIYKWEAMGEVAVLEYPDFKKNKKEKEDAECERQQDPDGGCGNIA